MNARLGVGLVAGPVNSNPGSLTRRCDARSHSTSAFRSDWHLDMRRVLWCPTVSTPARGAALVVSMHDIHTNTAPLRRGAAATAQAVPEREGGGRAAPARRV